MNIAILGCGKQAPKHISGLIEHPSVSHIYVADLFPAQADTLASRYESKVSAINLDTVFTQDNIDAIVITTPTKSHFELCKQSILSGKPFLVEKPLASNYEQAQELMALSMEHNVPGMVGFIYRFASVFDKVKTLISGDESSILGSPQHALFRIAGRGSDQPWKHQTDKMGGAVNEMMVHMIDLAVWYFGQANEVELLDSDIIRKTRDIRGETIDCDAEDWCVAQLKMENGTRVLLQADMVSPVFKQFMELNAENGIVEGSIQNTYGNALTLFEARGNYSKGHQPWDTPHSNLYVSQVECFMDMVTTGNQPAKCTLAEAVEVMRIQKILQQNLRNGKNS